MSFPLASTQLWACQDQMLVDTLFMVISANTVPSLASSNEDLAPAEQLDKGENQLSDGDRGTELNTVDTEPVSHDDRRFYDGVEFVIAATYTEVGGCEADTQQDIIRNDYKKFQSAPILGTVSSIK